MITQISSLQELQHLVLSTMHRRKISVSSLAYLSNLPRTSIYRFLADGANPEWYTIVSILEGLDITIMLTESPSYYRNL